MRQVLGLIGAAVALVFLVGCGRSASQDAQQQRAEEHARTRLVEAQQKWLAARWQARDAVLSDLTASHRVLLGSLIGQLSVAPEPNVTGAMRTLDGALDSKEKASIAWANQTLESAWKPVSEAARDVTAARGQPAVTAHLHPVVDPGAALLDLTMNSIALRAGVAIRQSAHAEREQAGRAGT